MISLVVLASLVSSYAYAEVYSYIGPKYEVVNGQYTTDMRVTGKLVTSSPIPPNSIDYDCGGILTSWSFNDGVKTIDNTSGVFNPNWPCTVSTDLNGLIISITWYVFVPPISTVVGGTDSFIRVWTAVSDFATQGIPCFQLKDGVCSAWSSSDNSGRVRRGKEGVWTDTYIPPIPTLSQWTLMLLALMLGLVGIARVRKHI